MLRELCSEGGAAPGGNSPLTSQACKATTHTLPAAVTPQGPTNQPDWAPELTPSPLLWAFDHDLSPRDLASLHLSSPLSLTLTRFLGSTYSRKPPEVLISRCRDSSRLLPHPGAALKSTTAISPC